MALIMKKDFIIILILCILSLILTIIAYASPHWVSSFAKSGNPFLNCGLWEFCWNDYTFPLDLIGRRYIGCFWVLGRDIYEFRDIILRPWFISVIVLFTIELFLQIVCSGLLALSWFNCYSHSVRPVIHLTCSVSHALMAVMSFVGLVVFGIFKEDREWMYRPDQNVLSWSYGCATVAMLFNIANAVLLYRLSVREKIDSKNYRPSKNSL